MFDSFDREITYLRVSVTDRCNLRCVYCMPESGVHLIRHEDVLSYEAIREVVEAGVSLGITKVRLTGGEPLVRRGIASLVEILSAVTGIRDLAMTTNGILLQTFAQPLAEAGLHRVNVSLDAMDPGRYAALTRGGDVREVLAGIEAAQQAGLAPVKLNCVIREHPDEPDARAVAEYAQQQGCEVRYIRRMNLSAGDFSTVLGGSGGDCARCNRLRLTSDGMVRPCLFSDLAFNVRELGAREALVRAIEAKPESGQTSQARFHTIGG